MSTKVQTISNLLPETTNKVDGWDIFDYIEMQKKYLINTFLKKNTLLCNQ